MKKVLFILGNRYSGGYESCQDFINRNHLTNLILIDKDDFFRRKHYLDKNQLNFSNWYKNLSDTDKNGLISQEVLNRIELNSDHVDNIIINGEFKPEDIDEISSKINLNQYGLICLNATNELMYGNYSILNGKYSDSYENFICQTKSADDFEKYLKQKYAKPFKTFVHNRNNNCDELDRLIASYFGYDGILLSDKSNQSYSWPIEPQYIVNEHDMYGIRPVHMILNKPKFHSGFDITSRTQTPVNASIDGTVTFSGLDERIFSGQSKWNQRYGNMIEVVDNFGRKQLYAHLRETFVKPGDHVDKNSVIGLTGCSGGARVPHLHFEIRKINTSHSGEKNTINPLELLPHRDFDKLQKHFDEKPYDEVWEKMVEQPWSMTDEKIYYSNSEEYIK